MIRALILYYLNIKPTHGYEIQKFIQLSGIEQWVKIQSGSIYYALNKLEKEKHIAVLREERTGSRISKVFQVTESGKKVLKEEMENELAKPLMNIGSMKFIFEPMINTIPKIQCETILNKHIADLEEQKVYWEKWKDIKTGEESDTLIKLSFDITINNIKDQIKWHKELLNNLDMYISKSKYNIDLIKQFDLKEIFEMSDTESEEDIRIQYIKKLKEVISSDPDNALNNLDKILQELQSKN